MLNFHWEVGMDFKEGNGKRVVVTVLSDLKQAEQNDFNQTYVVNPYYLHHIIA